MYSMVILIAALFVILPPVAFSGTKCSRTGNCNVVVVPARMCRFPVVPARVPPPVVPPDRICQAPYPPERACTRWVQEPCSYIENHRGPQSLGRSPNPVR